MRSSVDLPDPERPSRPTISPSYRVRSTSLRTTISPADGLGKCLSTPLQERTVAEAGAVPDADGAAECCSMTDMVLSLLAVGACSFRKTGIHPLYLFGAGFPEHARAISRGAACARRVDRADARAPG